MKLVTSGEVDSIIKGNVAFRGIVEGIVRVVKTREDLESFVEGEVLVAEKTQASYVMAMKKAIAFVTDVGGITSHAAIIAREYQIPCIVGTGNASKVLKSGDRVKVDAVNGVVEILN